MKKVLCSTIILSIFLGVGNVAFAKNTKNPKFAPDSRDAVSEGIYDVEGRSDLKVSVSINNVETRNISRESKTLKKPNGSLVCGLPDPQSETLVPPAGWHLPSKVTYRLNVSSVPFTVGQNNLIAFADEAFDKWSSASGKKVVFTRGKNTSVNVAQLDGQSVITWNRIPSTALGVTYTYYYFDTGVVVETDTILNTEFSWGWTDQTEHPKCAKNNVYDAQNALTHEIGHWMGLTDTYEPEFLENTMYGYASQTEIKKNTLSKGDRASAALIYGN